MKQKKLYQLGTIPVNNLNEHVYTDLTMQVYQIIQSHSSKSEGAQFSLFDIRRKVWIKRKRIDCASLTRIFQQFESDGIIKRKDPQNLESKNSVVNSAQVDRETVPDMDISPHIQNTDNNNTKKLKDILISLINSDEIKNEIKSIVNNILEEKKQEKQEPQNFDSNDIFEMVKPQFNSSYTCPKTNIATETRSLPTGITEIRKDSSSKMSSEMTKETQLTKPISNPIYTCPKTNISIEIRSPPTGIPEIRKDSSQKMSCEMTEETNLTKPTSKQTKDELHIKKLSSQTLNRTKRTSINLKQPTTKIKSLTPNILDERDKKKTNILRKNIDFIYNDKKKRENETDHRETRKSEKVTQKNENMLDDTIVELAKRKILLRYSVHSAIPSRNLKFEFLEITNRNPLLVDECISKLIACKFLKYHPSSKQGNEIYMYTSFST